MKALSSCSVIPFITVYYGRFGFSREAARGYECVYAGDHFMALKLDAGAPDRGLVHYPAAFNALT
jgi:putative acetyltransferase